MAFTVLFDACVLYPAPLRDLLIRLACTGLFRARWSDDIHDEWIRGVLRSRPELADRLSRTRQLMNDAVADALVTGYQPLIQALELPDADDRHVLAAAIIGRADVLVTLNLKDFPQSSLALYRIEPQHPDVFVRHVLHLDTAVALAAVKSQRKALRDPTYSVDEYLDTLTRQGLPETVAFLRPWSGLL